MNDRKGREFLYLSQADVRELQLPMAEIVAALGRMFHEKGEGFSRWESYFRNWIGVCPRFAPLVALTWGK